MAGFGTQLLDVAIGLMFVYVVMSLITSAIVEMLETALRTRSKYLWQGIGELLNDPDMWAPRPRLKQRLGALLPTAMRQIKDPPAPKAPLAKKVPAPPKVPREAIPEPPRPATVSVADLYQHPIVSALFYGTYTNATGRLVLRRLPPYIPRESFSTALIDLASKPADAKVKISAMESLRHGVAAMPKSPTRQALESIIRLTGDDIELVQRRIEAWYDTSMDSVSGWYKRHAQIMLLVVGFGLAAAANIDSWRMAVDLATNEPKRQALLESATEFAAGQAKGGPSLTGEQMKQYLSSIEGSALPTTNTRDRYSFIGWLITAFAISLGAPFWFDLLNKFMVIRSTVKPKEKSPDEASADRMPPSAGGSSLQGPTAFMQGHAPPH